MANNDFIRLTSRSVLFNEEKQTENGVIKVKGKIPMKGLFMSFIIIAGVALMQIEHATTLSLKPVLLCTIPIIIASFAYPLGNRKMMELSGKKSMYSSVFSV